MEFKSKQLQNGLTVIGEINRHAKSAAVGFFVKTGARDENENISGVSHFLEHMLFKGNEKLSAAKVNEAFDKTGAKFNASTSEENTVFYAAVLPEYLAEVTRLWAELMRPALRDDDFNIEKNVIKEEIAMYKDLPSYDVLDKCRRLYFDTHPCGNSVLGTEATIDNLKSKQMRAYFTRRYVPNNMVLACAGNLKWEQICSLAQKYCGSWPNLPAWRNTTTCLASRKKKRIRRPNLAREYICLMSRALAAQDPRRFAAHLLAAIVGDDVGSRFFWKLVDNALAETATMQFEPMDHTGVFCSCISCSSENSPKVMSIVNRIFSDLAKKGVTESELKKVKNKILSALVIKNELPMGRLVDLGFNWIYLHSYRTVSDDIEAIRSVTVGDINSLIKQLKPGKYTQLSLCPEKS